MNKEQREHLGSGELCTFPLGRLDESCVTALGLSLIPPTLIFQSPSSLFLEGLPHLLSHSVPIFCDAQQLMPDITRDPSNLPYGLSRVCQAPDRFSFSADWMEP